MSRRRAKANWEVCGLDKDRRELGRNEALLDVAEDEEKRGYGLSSSTFLLALFWRFVLSFSLLLRRELADSGSLQFAKYSTEYPNCGLQSLHRSLLAPFLETSTTFFAVSVW